MAPSTGSSDSANHAAFFYGTLMAPQVLHRVCHGSMSPENPIYTTSNLSTQPAILHSHRRHRVKGADYPAIISTSDSNDTVRGTYVTGLTENDLWRLDIFEGSEYVRQVVKVRVLDVVVEDDGMGTGNVEGEEVECQTYVWTSGKERLEASEWDFGEFRREKLRYWAGVDEDGMEREDILEVDAAVAAKDAQDGTGGRGFNGHISSALAAEHKKDEVIRNAV